MGWFYGLGAVPAVQQIDQMRPYVSERLHGFQACVKGIAAVIECIIATDSLHRRIKPAVP